MQLTYLLNFYIALAILEVSTEKIKKKEIYNSALTMYVKTLKYKNDVCELYTCSLFPPQLNYKYNDLDRGHAAFVTEGLFIPNCGANDILLSANKIVFKEGWKFCCALGMEPATIETREHLNCVYNAYKKNNAAIKESKFRMSYVDLGLNREFRACPDKRQVPQDLWVPGEPDNVKQFQSATAISLNTSNIQNAGYEDVNPLDKFGIACQRKILLQEKMLGNNEIAVQQKCSLCECGNSGCVKLNNSQCNIKTMNTDVYELMKQKLEKISSILKRRGTDKN